MQTEQFQKINNLVKNTPVLSGAEKDEWLQLLELMSDRQLLELERILSSSQQPAASSKQIPNSSDFVSSYVKVSADKKASSDKQFPTPNQSPPTGGSGTGQVSNENVKLSNVQKTNNGNLDNKEKSAVLNTVPSKVKESPVASQIPAADQPFMAGINFGTRPAASVNTQKVVPPPAVPKPPVPKPPVNLPKLSSVAPAQIIAGQAAEKPEEAAKNNSVFKAQKNNGLSASTAVPAKISGGFSHILNLPKTGSAPKPPGLLIGDNAAKANRGQSGRFLPVPPILDSKTVEDRNQSRFFQKLKNIFTEKELPAPKESFGPLSELAELSGPQSGKTALKPPFVAQIPTVNKNQPKPFEKKEPRQKAEEAPKNITFNLFVNSDKGREQLPAAEPALKQPSGGISQKSLNDLASGLKDKYAGKPLAVPEKNSVSSLIEKMSETALTGLRKAEKAGGPLAENKKPESIPLPTLSDEEVKALPKGKNIIPSSSDVKPGLNFKDSSGAGLPSVQKPDAGKTADGPIKSQDTKIVLTQKRGDDMKLESLEDVSGLSPQDLDNHATATFLAKLQKLINHYGRHEVVFNLEKSPLYRAYVNTGVELLKAGAGDNSSAAGQLKRENFENFMDLLIVMGSKT